MDPEWRCSPRPCERPLRRYAANPGTTNRRAPRPKDLAGPHRISRRGQWVVEQPEIAVRLRDVLLELLGQGHERVLGRESHAEVIEAGERPIGRIGHAAERRGLGLRWRSLGIKLIERIAACGRRCAARGRVKLIEWIPSHVTAPAPPSRLRLLFGVELGRQTGIGFQVGDRIRGCSTAWPHPLLAQAHRSLRYSTDLAFRLT